MRLVNIVFSKQNQILVLEMFFVIQLYLNFFSTFLFSFFKNSIPSKLESYLSRVCPFFKLLDIHKSGENSSIMSAYIYFIN